MTDDNNTHDWREELDRVGEEAEIETDLDLDPDSAPVDTEIEVEETTVIVDADEKPVGTTHRSTLENGVQKNKIEHRVPDWECSNCGFSPSLPLHKYPEDAIPEQETTCGLCETSLCTKCYTECTCDKPLCYDHRTAFSDREITLCPDHAAEKRQERQLEAELEIAEQRRKDTKTQLDVKVQEANIQMQYMMQKHQQQMEKLQTYLDERHRQNQLELQRWQTKLQHELERRKQMLAEQKAAAEIDIKRQQQELEEEKLELERKQHDDEMAVKRRKQSLEENSEYYQQQLQREKHRLQKVSKLVSVAQQLEGMDNRRLKKKLAKATKRLSKSDLPKVTA